MVEALKGTGEISREFTVWCAECEEWHQECIPTMKMAINAFKSLGWKKTKVVGWICPKHTTK